MTLQINELFNYFKSLKKRSARAAQNGTIERSTNTKLPLPFAVYKCLTKQFFMGTDGNGQKDALSFVFAHLYLLMAWSSMQRASNVQEISLNHLALADDYMQLYIFA
jgi:CO dehydrogenase/acetyl-CoA synthase epsilon subunit